jgi:hypothetical protein
VAFIAAFRIAEQKIQCCSIQIGDNGGEPKHLLTIHGVGYKLVSLKFPLRLEQEGQCGVEENHKFF